MTQGNTADAEATASAGAETQTGAPGAGSDDLDGPGDAIEADVRQRVDAVADAIQEHVGNLAVSVRVDSPGDNAPVTQTNGASASAVGNGSTATAAATASQSDVWNTNVSVRVFSPGSDGAVTQSSTASATASGANASSVASQDGVHNTNVSIRVDSPGGAGAVTQGSSADAALAITGDGSNTNLAVAVTGQGLAGPGPGDDTVTIWRWTWVWRADGPPSASAVEEVVGSWSWSWGDITALPGGTVETATAPSGTDPGWTWTWEWERGDGWDWQWSWGRRELDCACVWVWDWDWQWDDAPVAPAPGGGTAAPAAQPAPGATVQQTAATATATASATAVVSQGVDLGGDALEQGFVGQLASVVQDVLAEAEAVQLEIRNVADGLGAVSQTTDVDAVAEASAAVRVAQDVRRSLGGAAEQWVGQDADVVQDVSATATAIQTTVATTAPGGSSARASAVATAEAQVVQSIAQDAVVLAGELVQWAGQLAVVLQDEAAEALTVQSGLGAAGSARAASTARASSLALIDQAAVQGAGRGGGSASQASMQISAIDQAADAAATTTQTTGTLASSAAHAETRALVEQHVGQLVVGAGDLDVQEAYQETLVAQVATAVSISDGGIAGLAAVVNCAVVQQAAGQAIGTAVAFGEQRELPGFCDPPAPAPTGGPLSAAGGAATPQAGPAPVDGPAPMEELELAVPHGAFLPGGDALRPMPSALPALRTDPSPPPSAGAADRSLTISMPTRAGGGTAAAPAPGIGARPGSPLLPAVGWLLGAVATAASTAASTGGGGLATILAVVLLAHPRGRRWVAGPVVRRPAFVPFTLQVPG